MAVKKKNKEKSKKKPVSTLVNQNYGLRLYLQGVPQNEIAERCGVSNQTITEWKQRYDWETKRAARTISLEELASKCMAKASQMLDADLKDFNADAFAKAIAQLKTLIPKNTVDTDIMTFMAFQDMLLESRHELKLTDDFIKQVCHLQDVYVKRKLGHD